MKKVIKVLLMTSKSSVRDSIVAVAPPLGLWRLQYYLSQRGVECDVIDFSIDSEEDYLRKIQQGRYDIVGMSVTHHNMVPDLEILWKCRMASKKSGKRCLFIAGGHEATLNYKEWLQFGKLDLILLGYAERSLYELCRRFSEAPDNIEAGELLEGMDGYVVLDKNGQAVYKPAKILTREDFREFSFCQVLKMDMPFETYWKELRNAAPVFGCHKNIFNAETVRLYTTSHCPMVCGFCQSRAFIRESQKRLSPILMLSAEEVYQLVLHHVNKYGAKGFLFSDEDFLVGSDAGLKRVFDFCNLVIEAKKNGSLPKEIVLNSQARIDDFLIKNAEGKDRPVNHRLINIMRDAGFHSFGIGVETFSDRLLKSKSINKLAFCEAEAHRVLDAILESGLIPTINLILGVPESTVEDLVHTMKVGTEFFNKGCQIAVTALMDSFPGSTIHGSPDYKLMPRKWRNPYTGEDVVVASYFIPNDNRIADIVGQIRPVAILELDKIKARSSWNNPLTPKGVHSLSFFVAIAKLLELKDLYDYFTDTAYNVLAKERAASEESHMKIVFNP
ncbi:MAG: cobalamin-dependent protein [Candidatus Omnitrophota bacterium]